MTPPIRMVSLEPLLPGCGWEFAAPHHRPIEARTRAKTCLHEAYTEAPINSGPDPGDRLRARAHRAFPQGGEATIS